MLKKNQKDIPIMPPDPAHEVLVSCLGGLSLPRKSVVRLTDRPDMTLDVYRGRKETIQQQQQVKVTVYTLMEDNYHAFLLLFLWSKFLSSRANPILKGYVAWGSK